MKKSDKNSGTPFDGKWFVVGIICKGDRHFVCNPQLTKNPANWANDVRAFYAHHPEMSVSMYPSDYAMIAYELSVDGDPLFFDFPSVPKASEVENV